MITEHAPGRTGTSSPPADLAEVVCADPDLLALEFDALMAANYPGSAVHPAPRPPRPATRLLTRRPRFTRPSRPTWGGPRRSAAEQVDEDAASPRQRGPPAATRPPDRASRR